MTVLLFACFATYTRGADILYVGNVPLDAADTSIVNHLRARNYTVKIVDDNVAKLSDANNVTLVMISSSVDSAVLGATFLNVSARVLVWDPAIQFDMAMTGPIENTDFGINSVGDRLHVMDHNHQLAATLTGNDEVVFNGVTVLGWGVPNGNADLVARERDGDHRPLIYEYDKGAVLMNGQPAPNKRIFFFMGDNGVDGLNANGLELFDSIFDFSFTGGDKESPLINHVPLDIYVEATSPAGAVATYDPAVIADNDDPDPAVTYSHASGALYPMGTTTVTITATDSSGNKSTASFLIIVQDTTPPAITVPADVVVEAGANSNGAIINYNPASATDAITANPLITYSKASGTFFPLGTTIVTVTAKDNAGNSASATFKVSILDTTPPTIGGGSIINGNMTVQATGPNGAVVTFVGAVDTVDPNPTVNANPPSGSTFPLGITTVNVVAKDASNNTTTGSFTITVVDTIAPVLTVPANITLEGNASGGAIVTYPAASATDAVTLSPLITYSKASGTLFALGTTTVTVTATDAAGNASTGSFTITVTDTTPPVIGGVGIINGNMTVQATGPNGAVVTFVGAVDTVDPNPTVTANPPSGSTFPLGITTVNVVTKDASNNTTTGSFTITVVDTIAPVLAVPANITLEGNASGGAVVTYPAASATDAVTLNPLITYSKASGALFALGTTTVTVTATDAAGNASTGSFTITVTDTTPPVIGGVGIINGNMTVQATGPNGAVVTFVGAVDTVDPNPTVTANPPSGSTFPLGITTVNVVAKDASNNTTTGSFTITVVDTIAPVLTVPANITLEGNASGGAIVTYPAASATDAVTLSPAITYSKASGTLFALGTTTVTVTATDSSGNKDIDTFTVTVVDTTPPVVGGVGIINGNMTVEAAGPNGAVVTFVGAVDTVDPNPTVTANPPSGSTFPLGVTTVNVVAKDASNNTTTGSFTITVVDTTAPVIAALANITLEGNASGGAIVNYPAASATDAVTLNPLITYSKASGTLFPVGTTTVTVTAKDNAGNSSTATFKVSVLDTTPPTIGGGSIINGNMTVEATGPNGAVVTFIGAVDTVDPNPTITANPPSGSTFPLGITTVHVVAKDASNNTTTGSFTITVVDTIAPVLTVPANITLEGNASGGAIVTYSAASATDAVTLSPAITYSKASGSLFALGTTTVTVTAKDSSGNADTDTFTVTVVDTTPPVIGGVGIINGNMTVEATGPDGAVVTFIGATDTVDPNPTVICNPPSGSTFPLGANGVSVVATDSSGNTTIGSFTITVVDTTPPVLANVPADKQVEAASPSGTAVTFAPATATDIVTLNPVITYSHLSGSSFQVGTTTVTVTATDNAGNKTSDTFTVTVVDTTPPTIGGGPIINGNLTAEATGPNGAIVDFVGATDNSDPNPTIVANPPSGSQFPLGVTTVNVTATDSGGNSKTGSFTVTVVDTTPPEISDVPADISIVADNSNGMSASWTSASATDLVSTPVISYSKSSGSTFPLGETTVTITATDAAGNASTATFKVTVTPDVTAPIVISGPTANPNPALVGQVVSFSCAVSDTLPVLWNWNFGDGITNTASGNVGHAYATAGTYPVTLEITDASGLKTSRQLTMIVVQPSTPPIDTDGDGIPDYLDLDDDNDGYPDDEEIAAGTDPLDPNSFPKKPMVITKLTGSAKFNAKGKDGYGVAGFLPNMPAGFDPAGKTISLDLGGATAEFKLDAKGRGKNANGLFRVKMKMKRNKQTKKKEFLGGPVQFQARLKNGDWTPTWKDEGIDPKESKKKAALPIVADMKMDKSVYTNKVDSVYNSKAAKGGVFKFTMKRKK